MNTGDDWRTSIRLTASGVIEVAYTNYTNLDAGYARPYKPGDRLVSGHRGHIDIDRLDQLDLHAIAGRLYIRHNRDDRPDGLLCPSMSIGDVIVIGETAVSVDTVGFRRVTLDGADLITDRSWRAVITEGASPTANRRQQPSARDIGIGL